MRTSSRSHLVNWAGAITVRHMVFQTTHVVTTRSLFEGTEGTTSTFYAAALGRTGSFAFEWTLVLHTLAHALHIDAVLVFYTLQLVGCAL